MIDILSDIFETIRLRGTLYFRNDCSPPWAITVPAYAQAARFHLVIQGRCHVRLASGRDIDLGLGDLVLIPRGQGHVLSDSAGRTPAPLEQIIQESGFDGKGAFVIRKGDPQAATRMVCGHLAFSQGADHPLLAALPEVLVMTQTDRDRHPLLDESLRLVARRALTDEPGTAASISRLSEVFFIEAIRPGIEHHPALARVMNAMTDSQIGRALELVTRLPATPGRSTGLQERSACRGVASPSDLRSSSASRRWPMSPNGGCRRRWPNLAGRASESRK